MIYLASPYSHPDREVRVKRFEAACRAAARLLAAGHHVFCPIAHFHPIAELGGLRLGWDVWADYDQSMIALCDEVWVLTLDGWQESVGVAAEMKIAREMGKQVRVIKECDLT